MKSNYKSRYFPPPYFQFNSARIGKKKLGIERLSIKIRFLFPCCVIAKLDKEKPAQCWDQIKWSGPGSWQNVICSLIKPTNITNTANKINSTFELLNYTSKTFYFKIFTPLSKSNFSILWQQALQPRGFVIFWDLDVDVIVCTGDLRKLMMTFITNFTATFLSKLR